MKESWDVRRIIEQAEIFIEKQGFDRSSLAKKLGFPSRYVADIKAGKSKNPSSDFILALINKLNFNPVWLETFSGEIFLSPQKEEKHPLISNLEGMIDQRLEKLEARIAELETYLKESNKNTPDSGLYTADPAPEYSLKKKYKILYVENIAAGPPINQSDDLSNYIDVPRDYIKTGHPEDYYAARIQGQSMTAAGIPDDCMVLVRKSDVPRNGAIQVVRRGGQSTLKRMREHEDHHWTLHYEDDTGRQITIGPDDDYQVQGDFERVLPLA